MKQLFAVLLLGASATAMAQNVSVGGFDDVQGLVSVRTNGTLGPATKATSLSNGSVVLNSASGYSFIRLNNGCTVALKPNQVLTINTKAKCTELSLSVKDVSTIMARSSGGGGGAGVDDVLTFLSENSVAVGVGVGVAATATATVYTINKNNKNNQASGS